MSFSFFVFSLTAGAFLNQTTTPALAEFFDNPAFVFAVDKFVLAAIVETQLGKLPRDLRLSLLGEIQAQVVQLVLYRYHRRDTRLVIVGLEIIFS